MMGQTVMFFLFTVLPWSQRLLLPPPLVRTALVLVHPVALQHALPWTLIPPRHLLHGGTSRSRSMVQASGHSQKMPRAQDASFRGRVSSYCVLLSVEMRAPACVLHGLCTKGCELNSKFETGRERITVCREHCERSLCPKCERSLCPL
jgi:hypothetical protein